MARTKLRDCPCAYKSGDRKVAKADPVLMPVEPPNREAFMKLRAEGDKKALAVVTPAQKIKWDAMLGKELEFQMPQRGGDGGGGGIR